eukprot:gene12760-26877_t
MSGVFSTQVPQSWEQEMAKIISKIGMRRESEPFREPVPWEALGLSDYIEVVKLPMDLGTVKRKLDSKEYRKQEECASDLRLIWPPTSEEMILWVEYCHKLRPDDLGKILMVLDKSCPRCLLK